MPGLNDIIMKSVDAIFAAIPQPKSSSTALKHAKIVAHRGLHEPDEITENTLKAFDLAVQMKLWGIEFDVRWTQDEVPIILHDPHPERVFPDIKANSTQNINQLSHRQLTSQYEQIPSLKQVIDRYGGHIHLFIEIKEPLDSFEKKSKMRQLLSQLKPCQDFHIMSLNIENFDEFDFLPSDCFLPIAEWNTKEYSQLSLKHDWAGLTGHYLLLNRNFLKNHGDQRQHCGTGFINSKNLLYRELNRGVEWLFTDRGLKIKALLEKALNS